VRSSPLDGALVIYGNHTRFDFSTCQRIHSSVLRGGTLRVPHKPALHPRSPAKAMESFKVLFIGAGAINFGTPRAPWNHAARLEKSVPVPVPVPGDQID